MHFLKMMIFNNTKYHFDKKKYLINILVKDILKYKK